jgi:hypothetical protein
MSNIDGHTRDWLEQQLAYHTKMKVKSLRERDRIKARIKRAGASYKQLALEHQRHKQVLVGIKKLLSTENWEV